MQVSPFQETAGCKARISGVGTSLMSWGVSDGFFLHGNPYGTLWGPRESILLSLCPTIPLPHNPLCCMVLLHWFYFFHLFIHRRGSRGQSGCEMAILWQLQVKCPAPVTSSIKGSWLITDVRGLGGTRSWALNIFCKHGVYLPRASLTALRYWHIDPG